MTYSIQDISLIVQGDLLQNGNHIVEHLLTDSRKVYFPATSVFFAITTSRRNAHQFIPELYNKGVRSFIINDELKLTDFADASFIRVPDTLIALQTLAAYHRSRFNIPVIGITGSNGKTIVKEWLNDLLHKDLAIVRSPRSFNSQVGVPLSVWLMNESHSLGIFEAGISEVNEMESLQKIIQPTIGVLTNIGEAHNEGFSNKQEKLREKLKLFRNCTSIIYCSDVEVEQNLVLQSWFTDRYNEVPKQFFTWSKTREAWLTIKFISKSKEQTIIDAVCRNEKIKIAIPFTDDASIENAITCWCVLLSMNIKNEIISEKMNLLRPVNMRLELKKGINHCTIINDSYSADISSLNIALNFLDQQNSGEKRTAILSDFLESGQSPDDLYKNIADIIYAYKISRVIAIGPLISKYLQVYIDKNITTEFYLSPGEFKNQFRFSRFRDEIILVKGARIFEFEEIVHLLEQKVHQTVLEIDLNAISHNLKQYQQLLKPFTKVMAMVKAFAYGSGGAEIAGILQFHKVDYLGVAYADEGVELRKAGINLPIMVLNAEASTFESILNYNLEPDIYSFELLKQFDAFLINEGLQQYPVHLEIETGMNRLGFSVKDISELITYLGSTSSFKVESVFSHLAASEEIKQDVFTKQQFDLFVNAVAQLKKGLGYEFISHIANSAAIIRHPYLQMDMVRLGIGLYGVDSAGSNKLDLATVATLKSTIAQIKHLKQGESVSYNRKGIVNRDSVIATIRIGYADGYIRRLGNGNGKVLINGKMAPVIGTVCMDMIMADITGIDGVQEGDEVIIFGKDLPVQQLADWAGTIPYEIMTGISQRVKRIYYQE